MSRDPSVNAALFNFCQMADDGPRGGEPRPPIPKRSAEELKWLKDALESVEPPEKVVKRLIATIQLGEDHDDSEVLEALEELADTVEDLNWALEFCLMGGHQVVLALLRDGERAKRNAAIRRGLALVIANACQQNDRVQSAFNEAQWAQVVVPMARAESDKGALAALLHACSCMCRECDTGSAAFLQHNGMELLQALLDPGYAEHINEKIALRVLFLVSYFGQVGVSSEKIVQYSCAHVVLPSNSEDVAKAAAKAVSELIRKSPRTVKAIAAGLLLQPLQQTSGTLDAGDPRKTLLAALQQLDTTTSSSPTAAGESRPLLQ